MTCIIVRHGAYQEYERIYKAFGRLVPVVWARRRACNRPRSYTDPSASYPNVRQKPPPSWTGLGFVVVDRPAAWVLMTAIIVGFLVWVAYMLGVRLVKTLEPPAP